MNLQRAMDFLQSGTFQPGTIEYKWWEYYDRIVLANATAPNNYKFFAIPQGQGGKGYADTNWQVANQMPESERMAVMYFCFYYIPAEARTQAEFQKIVDLMKTAYFNFSVYNKPSMIQFPLAVAFSSYMPVQVGGAAAGDQNISRTAISGCYELGIEIPLAAKTTLSAEIIFAAATDADLDGDKIILSMVGPKYNL
jgi:hypothetical protein